MIQIHLSRFTFLNNFFLLPKFKYAVFQCAHVFYHYPVYFFRAVFNILHCFTACTDNETSISKRLNEDDPFTNRLRFNLPETEGNVLSMSCKPGRKEI